MEDRYINIEGAREHNLKNIILQIPRDKLTVITGISGSGKSSLAFDTLYAEGNRRYVESLTAYARQFLEQWPKPDVDFITGLPPTVAIRQRWYSANPRSTVATVTDIYDYLRLLFSRVGEPHCPSCGATVVRYTAQEIIDKALEYEEGLKMMVLAPLVDGAKGDHMEVIRRVRREGFVRVRVNGEILEAREVTELPTDKELSIEAVVDRVVVKKEYSSRIGDSVELALGLGEGRVILSVQEYGNWQDRVFYEHYACPACKIHFAELTPRDFSFNSPYGACMKCGGLGTSTQFDETLLIPDDTLSILGGAVVPWRQPGKKISEAFKKKMEALSEALGFSLEAPYKELPRKAKEAILRGTNSKNAPPFEGLIPLLEKKYQGSSSEDVKGRIHRYMGEIKCPDCKGARLKPESLSVAIRGKNISEITHFSIDEAEEFFGALTFSGEAAKTGGPIAREIYGRLKFMKGVGLGYLSLDRPSHSLSGGESQRIHLATQIGSGLVGVAYILDEPTIGLHQRDTALLLTSLVKLKEQGNSIIVVEHDEETIRAAEHLIDVGPGAGLHGGNIIAEGTVEQVTACESSLTGKYLSGELSINLPIARRKVLKKNSIKIKGASENNLKDIDVDFPLGCMVCITGVSGSGKSTLISHILYRALKRYLDKRGEKPGEYRYIYVPDFVERVVRISQAPIGKSPRSNPATYSGLLSEIRNLFAMTTEAKIRGYQPNRFSFNVRGGRCEVCQGQGTRRIEMHFLPDVFVTCESCKGTRYNRETLEIRYRGKNIAEVLDLRVEEAIGFFKNFPKISGVLETLNDVGLGYIKIGQSSTTLSGGEAQRIKLASELMRGSGHAYGGNGHTVYIMDEPTTGLHFADISRFLEVVSRLVDKGNSLIVIEHNLDFIKAADWIIDLGPEGGDAGGEVIAQGTPEQVAKNPNSHTARYLKETLARSKVL